MGDALLYLTSLGVTLSGVFAFFSVVESNILRIPSLIFILNGYLLSYLIREKKYRRIYSSFFVIVLVFLLIIDAIKGKGLLLFPPDVGGEPGLIVGNFLLWLVVLRSYTLFTPGYLLFSIVPSVAFLGLISAYSVDPELFVYASLCYLFSILLLGYSSYDLKKLAFLRSYLFLFGSFVFLLSTILAFLLLAPLRSLCSVVPLPQVYVHISSLLRQELLGNIPFLQNALMLGSGLPRGEEVICEIKGNEPILLRAGTYDYFTGRYWVKTYFGFTTLRNQSNNFKILSKNPPYTVERYEIHLTDEVPLLLPPLGFPGPFFFMMGRRINILTPPHPCEVKFNSQVSPAYLVKGVDNSLSAVFYMRGDISYEVITQPHTPWDEEFVSAIYLQKPPSTRTSELAKMLTSPYDDDYQKAIAIQNYLQSNYSYRLTSSPPPQDNGVEWFLFKSKKGDCDFFASAMCILLREAGIPARVAIGYSVVEYDAEKGVWIVKQKDAHMWVEAYIRGKGWMTFDPTPPGGSVFQEFLISMQRYYRLNKRKIVSMLFFLISLCIFLFLLRISWRETRERVKRVRTNRERLVNSFLALCKKLAKIGLPPRGAHHTLREWLKLVAPFITDYFLHSLVEVTNVCEEACYNKTIEEEKVKIALEKVKELRRAKRWQVLKTSIS